MLELDRLAWLIFHKCNHDDETFSAIRQRLYETRKRQTYRVLYDTQEQIVGYVDYDITWDGIVHVRKLLALQPGVIWKLLRILQRSLPWKRVYFYRPKYNAWRHHRRPDYALA